MIIKLIEPQNRKWYYIGANAINKAHQTGATAGVSVAKQGIYSASMQANIPDEWDWESRLSLGGSKSSNYAKTGVLENELILRTDDGAEIQFLDAKIDVTKRKTVKAQALVNIKGSIKEYIQEDDYTVIIKGNIIIDDPFSFPVEELKLLNDILSKSESLSVASVFLNKIFEIDRLVFDSGNFNQSGMNMFNVFPITINFKSDIDHSFLIEDN